MQSKVSTVPVKKAVLAELTSEEIVEKIYTAILEHRLAPGTKLGEDRLASIFSASRARVREVLARLANERVVELIPQRGAFVAKPTVEQANDVFEARRLIEPGIVRRLIERMDNNVLISLREHQRKEAEALRLDDKRAIVRLSGEFHLLLAELAGNTVLVRTLRELSTITCLIIFLYDAPTATTCRADDHADIVAAIVARDAAKAQALMLHHLDDIQQSLRLESSLVDANLEAIFQDL
ncbi:MAG: GntR family transcriptional regulator [Alphaproteobacteria bacterium]|nr:MAG: GntR family transcriptional regulator [Alphaproteobacteria bacterium]